MPASRIRLPIMLVVASIFVMAPERFLTAQMINVRTPFQSTRDNYHERTGINFGLGVNGGRRIRGLSPTGQLLPRVQFTQGSAGVTAPTMGGYNPNASLRTGFATIGGDVNVAFGLEMGKGSRRSLSSTTPMMTMMNGQGASIFSGANRPFVTRIDPVIGMGGNRSSLLNRPSSDPYGDKARSASMEPRTYSSPTSTAVSGDISVAEIKRHRQMQEMVEDQELLKELTELTKVANDLSEQGQFGAARAKLGRALRKVADKPKLKDVELELRARLKELKGKR